MTDVSADGVRYVKCLVDATPESSREGQMFDGQCVTDQVHPRRIVPTTDTPMFGSRCQATDGASRAASSGTHRAGLNPRFGGI